MTSPRPRRGILLAVPFYRNEHLVAPLVDSLLRCAEEFAELGMEALFLDDSPEHPALAGALAAASAAVCGAFPLRVVRMERNAGFVCTSNRAIAAAVESGRHLLLMNSDTVVEPGAFREMRRVLEDDPMTVFVNPRSNNASIASLPLSPRLAGLSGGALYAALAATARRLPAHTVAPVAVGFCMLCRWDVLAEFGGFDEIYAPGYNEENDLVMRVTRCGYRAMQANHAFVWHENEGSFGTAPESKSDLETRNRAILDARYPEYEGHTTAFFHAPERHAEALLAELVPGADGRLPVALDFSGFRADHNGTFKAGAQLLAAAPAAWGERFQTSVLCTEEVYAFHGFETAGVPRCDPHAGTRFAAVLRFGQPFDWESSVRLFTAGAAAGVAMLDTIAVDCPQLASPFLNNLWQFTIGESDLLLTQSEHTAQQVDGRFTIPEHVCRAVVPHSLALADYAPGPLETAARTGLLVVGNHFPHKHVAATANALARAFPERTVTVLGLAPPSAAHAGTNAKGALDDLPNIVAWKAGLLDDAAVQALYAGADAVIFPSHAEGFGFPVLDALAAQKPVYVRPLPVFAEMRSALGETEDIRFFETTAALVEALAAVAPASPRPDDAAWDGGASARAIGDALSAALARASYARIRDRIRHVQIASAVAEGARPPPPRGRGEVAARLLATRVERAARPVLSLPPVFLASRVAYRSARAVIRAGWRVRRVLGSV